MRGKITVLPAVFLMTSAAWGGDGCAGCHHFGSETRAPLPDLLAQMPRQAIIDALEKGSMKTQASMLTPAERRAVADYLVKPSIGEAARPSSTKAGCTCRSRRWRRCRRVIRSMPAARSGAAWWRWMRRAASRSGRPTPFPTCPGPSGRIPRARS